MNCSSTNGRLDILGPNIMNQFALYDKIPNNDCSSFNDAMIGNSTESSLSIAFFSKGNIQIIQNAIRAGVYEVSNQQYVIDNQNCDTLKVIMRSVFLQSAVNQPDNITGQIQALNNLVVEYCVKHVYSEAQAYINYKRDVSTMYTPIDRPVQVDVDDKTLVLFNKGSNELVKYNSTYRCDTNEQKGWFLVKNPLVRLDTKGSKIDAIIVEFNSIEHPDVFHAGANTGDKICTGNMVEKDNNLIGIKELASRNDLRKQWNMITIIVSETSPDDDVFVSSNQAVVKLYLNGYAYLDKDGELAEKSTAMKVNNSDLHIGTAYDTAIDNSVLPTGSNDTGVGISDLTYFNYALEDKEIVSLFKEGCKKSTALIPTASTFDDGPEATEASLEIKSHNHPKSL